MRLASLLHILFFICVFSMPMSAHAELDENGQRLKSMFEDFLSMQKQLIDDDNIELIQQGELSVEKAGNYYAITFPHLSVQYQDGSKFIMGIIAVNAAPHTDPDSWKMTLAIPFPMSVISKDNTPLFSINIGGQRTAGIWNGKLKSFSKLDMKLEDLKITDAASKFITEFGELRSVYDLFSTPDNLWSGPISFTAKDVNIGTPIDDVVKFGEISASMQAFSFNPNVIDEYTNQLVALKQSNSNMTNGAGDLSQHTDIMKDFTSIFIKLLGDGFTSNYTIKDMVIKAPKDKQNKPGNPFNELKIGSATIGFDMTGILKNQMDLVFRMGYNDLDITPFPKDFPKLAPTTFQFDIGFLDLPINEISKLGEESINTALQNPQMGKMAGLGMVMQLPDLLAQSNSSVVMKNNVFGNDIYNVAINGIVKPAPASPFKSTADVTTTIEGFDAIMQSLQQMMQDDPSSAKKLQGLTAGLMMVKGFADAQTGANGEPQHVLKLNVSEQGQIFLNGSDMSAMFGLQVAPQ